MKTALKYFLIYLGLSLAGGIILAIPAAMFQAVFDSSSLMEGKTAPWVMSVTTLGSQILPLYLFWKNKWADFTFLKGQQYVKLLAWMVIGLLGCQLVEGFVQAYMPSFDWDINILNQIQGMTLDPIGLLAVCVMAPLVEEGVFRGTIERKMLEKNMNPWWAIVISALLFAIMHINLTQGITALILGLFLGWVYYRTRNIWLCIFVHAVNNTMSSVLSLTTDDAVDATFMDSLTLPVNLLLLVAGAALVLFATRFTGKTVDETKQMTA